MYLERSYSRQITSINTEKGGIHTKYSAVFSRKVYQSVLADFLF